MSEETNKIIHVSRMQEEILFQKLVHNESFQKIPVGELRCFAHFAIVELRNYDYDFKTKEREKILVDVDFNENFVIKALKKL